MDAVEIFVRGSKHKMASQQGEKKCPLHKTPPPPASHEFFFRLSNLPTVAPPPLAAPMSTSNGLQMIIVPDAMSNCTCTYSCLTCFGDVQAKIKIIFIVNCQIGYFLTNFLPASVGVYLYLGIIVIRIVMDLV